MAGRLGSSPGLDEAALVAVIAHGLMTNVALVQATANLLREGQDTMDPRDRDEAWELLAGQVRHIGDVLLDLVRQVPPESVEAMEEAIREVRL